MKQSVSIDDWNGDVDKFINHLRIGEVNIFPEPKPPAPPVKEEEAANNNT